MGLVVDCSKEGRQLRRPKRTTPTSGIMMLSGAGFTYWASNPQQTPCGHDLCHKDSHQQPIEAVLKFATENQKGPSLKFKRGPIVI